MESLIYRIAFMYFMKEARSYRRTDIERFGFIAMAFAALSNARKIERGY